MTKRYILHAIACSLVVLMTACTAKKGPHETEVSSDDDWVPMDKFHMIMAESFHPFRDSADLAPARANADSLVAAAERWLNSPLPEKVNNDGVKEKLQHLKEEADAFAIISKTDDQKAIGESLTRLHDLFHGLQEEWYGGHDEEHEHH